MPEIVHANGAAHWRARLCFIASLVLPLPAAATMPAADTVATPSIHATLDGAPPAPPAPPAEAASATALAPSTPAAPLPQHTSPASRAGEHVEQLRPDPAPPTGGAPAGFGPTAAANQLDSARGGADAMTADARLHGSVSSNSASQMTTGANRIESGSFAGAVGLPVVIQNSGANVLIQNATVINLQLK